VSGADERRPPETPEDTMTRTAPTYPGTETAIEIGDYVVALGRGEGNDWGEVLDIDETGPVPVVSIHWIASETGQDLPVDHLPEGLDIYTNRAQAQANYLSGYAEAARASGDTV
jgi:hypothetical protein